LLPEVHATREIQRELSEHGFLIYDFILPYLILEALLIKDSCKLKHYLRERPSQQVTMLDCHDGIPVKPDLDGIYDKETVHRVVETCMERGANMSRILSPAHQDPDGFDVHQIRGTYYSMLNEDDEAYFAARALQLFTPGVPQVYYVGLLAGRNDLEAVKKAGEGREINRHSYTMEEIEREIQRPLVKRIMRLIEFRNNFPAFQGDFHVEDSDNHQVKMLWVMDEFKTRLTVDLHHGEAVIEFSDETSGEMMPL
jgi:sucrose phosphorylase